MFCIHVLSHDDIYLLYWGRFYAWGSLLCSLVWTDMALEQSSNADSKSKAGIVATSQSSLQRWFLACHKQAAVTTVLKVMYEGDNRRP